MRYPRKHHRRTHRPSSWRWVARRRRALFTALIVGQSLLATYYMIAVLPYHGSTLLEIALAATFALNFAWVGTGAWLAVFGFVYRSFGGDRWSLAAQASATNLESTPLVRTALIMPIYHEPVARCLAGLATVYRSLERSGELEHFDFFVLSDSRDPDVWLGEQAEWHRWVSELGAEGRLHYRRRRLNLRYKSGNVSDFLRRWGNDYRYFVVLDADSLMDASTVARMVRLMECNPHVGIIQAPPRIVGARSLFARVQQFANGLYGPIFGTGLAALQLGDGAYWGHNAIIRTRAFMHCCGLPSLRGIGLFRGPILSHDFAEAAFMRRGGYEVWLEPTLDGSYEQSPPSLVDELMRDRRWARGNLQHLALMLGGQRLGLVQRFTFLNGILAYAAAPLWLLFLILTGLEAAQFTLKPIDYFPGGHHLFPLWPEWHPEWALRLAASTIVVLFVPKLLAGLDALFRARLRRGFGGVGRLTASILIESLVSVLLAPVRMLAHSRFVVEAVIGARLSWAGQNRDGPIGWWSALRMHGGGLLLGIAWGIFSWWLRPLYFYWSLPVTLPLVLAPLVAVVTSNIRGGDWLARVGLLVTPEERHVPRVVQDLLDSTPADADAPTAGLARTLRDPAWLAAARHFARRDGQCPTETLVQARRDGIDSLSLQQRSQLADDGDALALLSEQSVDARDSSHRSARPSFDPSEDLTEARRT